MNKPKQFAYMFICPRCGATTMLEEDTQFCTGCGISLVAPCPRCNTPVPPRYRYCQKCGMDLGEQPELVITSRPSWIQRNPNILILLGVVIVMIIALPLMFYSDWGTLGWVALGIGLLFYWGLSGCAIKMKGQSLGHLWWILLSFIPAIGSLATLVIWLSLSNKKA